MKYFKAIPFYLNELSEHLGSLTAGFLIAFKSGSLAVKSALALMLGMAIAPIAEWVDYHINPDVDFLLSMAVTLLIGFIGRVWLSWKQKDLDREAMLLYPKKAAFYFLLITAINTATNYRVHGETNTLLQYIDNALYCAMIIAELIPILRYGEQLGLFQTPKWLSKHLKHYDETGTLQMPNPTEDPNIAQSTDHGQL